MIDLYGVLQEQETVNGELGLGVDYYKGEQGIPGKDGKDGKDGSDQVYVGADEPTDERVKLWIDTDATPPSKTVSWDEIENKPEIPAPYTLPTASTSTLGGVKVDGNTITIADGVISSVGSTEPDAYIKDASISGNTLTLTKKDDTEVVFTPSGGSSGGGGYTFTSGQTFTDEDKIHLKEVYMRKNVYMTIDNLTVIRIMSFGSKRGFVVINTNGASSNRVQVYTVDIDSNINVISSSFSLYMSYGLMGSETLTGTILTTNNWMNYINIPEIKDWVYTTDMQDSNLYNAKEMIVFWSHNNLHASTYINLAYGKYDTGNVGISVLGNWSWENLLLAGNTGDTSTASFLTYTGSELSTGSNVEYLYGVLYKT